MVMTCIPNPVKRIAIIAEAGLELPPISCKINERGAPHGNTCVRAAQSYLAIARREA
jgi:hypothetical protein